MSEQQQIYVAGPYSAESEAQRYANTMRAIDVGIELLTMGHDPFIPHLTHFVHERALEEHGITVTYDEWMSYDETWLRDCDALFYMDPSPGADAELELAEDLGMDIYETLDEIPIVNDD